MIKANELRIGNFIIYRGEATHVTAIMAYDREDYNPIPVTPSWLEKFGFQKGFFGIGYSNGKRVEEYYLPLESCDLHFAENARESKYTVSFHYFGNNGESNEQETICEFEYVHQLQNLYFALTGQELEFKTASHSVS